MEGLSMFREVFATEPPEPLAKTAIDGAFHVAALNAHKTIDPVILAMWTATDPLFTTFSTDKIAFEKGEEDLKIKNAAFVVLEGSLNGVFSVYQETIVGIYPTTTVRYKELYWESISEMFRGGIATKFENISRFLSIIGTDVALATIKTNLLGVQLNLNTKMAEKFALKAQVEALDLVVRASQKLFCQEEDGNAGGLKQFYKTTPYVCNQYFKVTDIKYYKPTAIAEAKKAALLHDFAPNTITIVPNVLLWSNCKPNIKNLSMEAVKISSTNAVGSQGKGIFDLAPGKSYRKDIKFIGAVGNTLLVVDTTGCTENVKLKVEVK